MSDMRYVRGGVLHFNHGMDYIGDDWLTLKAISGTMINGFIVSI